MSVTNLGIIFMLNYFNTLSQVNKRKQDKPEFRSASVLEPFEALINIGYMDEPSQAGMLNHQMCWRKFNPDVYVHHVHIHQTLY